MSVPYSTNTNDFSPIDVDNHLSPSGDTSSTKRSNALSNKLTSVLSSSYANTETRDALRLLDARGAQDAEETRQNLKFNAQKDVIDANSKIVEDFGKVANQLKRVGALISILNQTCEDMRSHIQLSKQETAPMLEETSTLLSRKQETESKQQLLNAFNQHFLISDEDLTTLTSSAEPVNDRYFILLARVKQIHRDCEILLGYENQRLGLELMEQTTGNLDAAYKKLYNWIQREFKVLDLEDPHISGSIRRSLRALSERPTLFQNCLDFFGEARQVTLSEAFQKALTDSTLGSSKAIEFSTHDPLRYTGDMLAWAHSTTVSEKEALEGLFISDADEISRGLSAGKSSEPWARLRRTSSTANGLPDESDDDNEDEDKAVAPAFDGHAALNSLISRNMASVSQILTQRISLTIRNLSDPIAIYKTYNLLLFYEDIFVKLLGVTGLNSQSPRQAPPQSQVQSQNQNTLLTALSTLQSQALSRFQSTVREDADSHASTIESTTTPTSDLQPPQILSSHLMIFSSILRLRAPNLTKAEFTNLYTTLLTPILELCSSATDSLLLPSSTTTTTTTKPPHRTDPTSTSTSTQDKKQEEQPTKNNNDHEEHQTATLESTIYRLNYLHRILTTFTPLTKDPQLTNFITAPTKSLQTEIETWTEELSDILADQFLLTSGVQGLMDLTDDTKNGRVEEEKDVRESLTEQLEDASATLDTFLASALMDAQEDLVRLGDRGVVTRVVGEAVEAFCEVFEGLVGRFEVLDEEFEDAGRSDNKGGIDQEEKEDGGGDDEGDEMEHVLLRELYPRTPAEVRALLS